MSKQNRLEIRQTQKDLLIMSAGDLIPLLEASPKTLSVKQVSFQHYCAETKEFFQVQIIVTREEDDFLDPGHVEHNVELE